MNEESIQASGAPGPGWGDLSAKARKALRLTGRFLKRGRKGEGAENVEEVVDRPSEDPPTSEMPTKRSSAERSRSQPTPEPSKQLLERAKSEVSHFASENSALIDRAARFGDRSRRLEEEGTPSESDSRRAARARDEIRAGLASRRESFAASTSSGKRAERDEVGEVGEVREVGEVGEGKEVEEAALAFDSELERLYPDLHRILSDSGTP